MQAQPADVRRENQRPEDDRSPVSRGEFQAMAVSPGRGSGRAFVVRPETNRRIDGGGRSVSTPANPCSHGPGRWPEAFRRVCKDDATARVVVAEDLSPADLLAVEPERLGGLILGRGGMDCAVAILARSLGVPAVVTGSMKVSFRTGDPVVVDGDSGTVRFGSAGRLGSPLRFPSPTARSSGEGPARTRDGLRIGVVANVTFPGEVDRARLLGAEGIGLYRTETPFLGAPSVPGEREQLRVYRSAVVHMRSRPVTFRAFDLGSDRCPWNLPMAEETNPSLGWRSLRVALSMKGLFRTQLRAICRVSGLGPVRLLLPMVSGVEELREVNDLLGQVRADLRGEGLSFDENMPVGVLVEMPSVVYMADTLAEVADFVSLGTNDLTQFLLAADRGNPDVASWYDPLHPAVIRAIREVAGAAGKAGIRCSLCGEIASDPALTELLVGLGVRELSVRPSAIPGVRRVLSSVDSGVARVLADQALRLNDAGMIRSHLWRFRRTDAAAGRPSLEGRFSRVAEFPDGSAFPTRGRTETARRTTPARRMQ